MSVQAGIWNFDGNPVSSKLLASFREALRPQGPDGEFLHVDGAIALLYCPFHTTTESRREKQPFSSRRGFVLTWDGRLDNRDDLVGELSGDLEAEPTDVVIVAAAFDRWGTECFQRIIGDWAVSVWKPEQRELILAIDYMAIRHIFYYLKNSRVWWSTDLAPLVLLSGDKFRVDDDYIAGYLAHDPDAHSTPYRELCQVPAGQLVRIRNGKASIERYWRFSPRSRIRYRSDAEYEEHFRHLFRQSVRRRLRSDSAVLAELSGGLDSSSIVCMADDIIAKEGAQTPRLDTLSYYDKTEPNADDWIYFQKIEEKRGRVGAHIDASKLGDAPYSFEYPEFAPLPGYFGAGLQIETRRAEVILQGGYRAVLSGIGGDELTGAIPNPSAQLADLIVQFKFVRLAQELMAWSLAKRRPWIHVLGQAFVTLLPASVCQYFVKQARLEPWIQRQFVTHTKMAVRLLDVNEHFDLLLPTRRSYIGAILLMANKMAKHMPPTLALEEGRHPYLDQNLVEFLLSIPARQLLRAGERRSLMRRSLAGIVPPEILSRRTKQFGARTPVLAVDNNLGQLQAVFDSPLSSRLGYINPTLFLEKLEGAKKGEGIHIARMIKTISLELWLQDLVLRHLIDLPREEYRFNPARARV
jgi:asparagine synthase (glutamine-hydrolysing)